MARSLDHVFLARTRANVKTFHKRQPENRPCFHKRLEGTSFTESPTTKRPPKSSTLSCCCPNVFSTAYHGGAEYDDVSASTAPRESVAADNAFRLVLDASPDGLPVLVWQRVPRCE